MTCGKLGHPESRCFKKQKKEDNGANFVIPDGNTIAESDTHNTVGVTLVENSGSDSNEDVVASVKRAANGEALPKQARPNGIIPISSLLTPKTIPPATNSKAKKAKNKRATRREGISDYVGKYDVVSELANASTGLTFGQLIRGDGEKAKSEIRRLLTRGTRVRRNVAAAVPGSSLTVRPRRLKVVQIKTFGTDAEALLDSGAVPNLISEKLCKKLSVDFNKKHIGLTVADGQRAHSIGTITDVPISFDDLHISMDFYVMKNPPFEVIIGVPTLEALRGCLDFGLQQVTLFAKDKKAVLPFEYALIEVPIVNDSETDSEDFTSDSDIAPDDEDENESDLVIALAKDAEDASVEELDISEEEQRNSLILEKVSHLNEESGDRISGILRDNNIVAWSLQDLCPADVPVRHYFELTDYTPIHHRAHRLAPKHNEFVRKELDNLLDAGIIVPASSAWSFPIVIASKKDGSLRFCVDYRSLNRVMKADRWPLPRIEEIFDDLRGSTVFTTLDLFTGYWQVKMSETCKEMTTFVTRYGTFQFEVMPFGLMNAPSTFQRMMDVVLKGLEFVRVYIDDIVVFSKSMDDHISHLTDVFARLSDHNLKVKLSKCHFAQPQVKLLGHVINADGIHVDKDKIAVIKESPPPSSKTEIRSFLGLAGYYRRFIKNFAQTSSVLHAATSEKRTFTWTSEMMASFEELKQKLTSPPVLSFPDFDQPFIVETDASNLSLGGVLAQKKEDGKIHPIQFASRTMTDAEKKYSTCEREALAVIFALKKFRVYLLSSTPFTVITDHQALRHTFQKKDIHGRLARWLDFLAEYDFKIEYRSGKKNGAADYLSRIDTGVTVSDGYDEGDIACFSVDLSDFQGLEPDLISIASYLSGLSIDHLDPALRHKIRRNARKFVIWEGNLFRRTQKDVKFVPHIINRPNILTSYHDEIGHWDSRSTKRFIADRFWWPSMYKDIFEYVKTCEDCQKMNAIPKYRTALRTPITSLFDVFSIDFAGPFNTTPRGNKHLLVCMEHLTGWPIVCPTPTATAAEVINFVEDQIILPFGHPKTIVSDNGPCFTARSLATYMQEKQVNWKTVLAYAPMSNGRAERMVGTIKRAIGKMARSNPLDWDLAVSKVLYGYRRRHLSSGFSPFQLLYGVVPRMHLETHPTSNIPDSSPSHLSAETFALAADRATHVAKMNFKRSKEIPTKTFQVGEFVLVARGKSLSSFIKWPAFSSKFYGTCMVVSANHPRYGLVSPHNRYSRQDIHARRLVRYYSRRDITVGQA